MAVELGHVVHKVGGGHGGRRQVVHGHAGGKEALGEKEGKEGREEGRERARENVSEASVVRGPKYS